MTTEEEKASGAITLLRTLLACAGAGTETASGERLAWVVDGPAGVRGGIICGCATAVEAAVARALSIFVVGKEETRYYYVLYIGGRGMRGAVGGSSRDAGDVGLAVHLRSLKKLVTRSGDGH